MFNLNFFKKEEKKEDKDSKLYLIVFGVMLIVALVLTIYRKFENFFIKNDDRKEISKEIVKTENTEVEVIKEQSSLGILGNKDDLVLFSIQPNTKVFGIQSYRGSVKGGYFFEGNILVNILDENKNILKSGNATAKTDWMTREPIEFEGTLDFTLLPKGSAYIEIHNDNASGLPLNDKNILIPIIID